MKYLFMILSVVLTDFAFASETLGRNEISKTVINLYKTNQYEVLINLIDGYLSNEERTSSGIWKHTLAYGGISGVFNLQTTSEEYWDKQLDKALQLTEKYPQSSVFYLIHADGLIRKAMMYRTNKERDDINGYKDKFEQSLAKGHMYLRQIKGKASKDPRWYELMVVVAGQENWSQIKFNELINEAMNKHPFYYEIYFKAVKYMILESSGWDEELEEFISLVVENTYEDEKTALYARLHWYVLHSCNCVRNGRKVFLFERSPLDWQKMMTAIDDVLAQYPDEWNINHFAFFACHSGDPIGTKKLLDQMQDPPIDNLWGDSGLYQSCKEWADFSHSFLNNAN